MSFKRNFQILLRKSDKSISKIELNNGLIINNFDSSLQFISSKKIDNIDHRLVDVYFDIDTDNSIYGIINSKKGSLLYIYSTDKTLAKTNFLPLNTKKNILKFPYIKKLKKDIHILYYLIDSSQKKCCKLCNYYFDGTWHYNIIANLEYYILTNFIVTYEDSVPSVFFLAKNKHYEELFVSTFDIISKSWSTPYKITNSQKNKVYLSAIKDEHNKYHISYSENTDNKYRCIYFNGSFKNNIFEINHNYIVIGETITCAFPTILKYKSQLILQYIDSNQLFSSTSSIAGEKWTNPNINMKGNKNSFLRYDFKSNYLEDSKNIMPNYFSLENSISPLL